MNYEEFLAYVLQNGKDKSDRTKTGTLSIFGGQMRFDITKSFPLITTKKVNFPSVVHELLWFLKGDSNVKYLQDNNVKIWNEWADENGNLGPVYGVQWRAWQTKDGKHIDQIAQLIEGIKTNPYSRRHIVSAWNVGEIENMALPPCHAFFQFYVIDDLLSCQLYQRSADMFLGVPFNIASYSLLTYMVADQCGLKPAEFIWTGGDCHIYSNHIEQVKEQLSRQPFDYPTLKLNHKPSIFDYTIEDFEIVNYQHHPFIKAPIAV